MRHYERCDRSEILSNVLCARTTVGYSSKRPRMNSTLLKGEETTHIVVLVSVVLDPVHDDPAVTLLHLLEQVQGLGEILRTQPVGALLRDELCGVDWIG